MKEETREARKENETLPSTDRRNFLKTAGAAGAVGAAVAGAAYGKFSLAPIASAQAQTAAPKLSPN
jgi:nitrous oxide reductase